MTSFKKKDQPHDETTTVLSDVIKDLEKPNNMK